MSASVPTRRAKITVANPSAEPSQTWVHAVARLLLAHVDREIEAERAGLDEDQAGDDRHGDAT
jgi:hypothetical protein